MNMNKNRVLAFGTFDHFHPGHAFYLSEAKKLGDELIVVIARDSTVESIKGELPHHDEKERKRNVEESEIPDIVVLGDTKDKYKVIRKYKPSVIALGYDQYAFTYRLQKILIEEKLNTKIVRIKSFNPALYKSSLIKEKLRRDQ